MVTDVLERFDEVVPVKQLLRWQDDGGALAPGAEAEQQHVPGQRAATAPVSTTATAQPAP